MSAVLQRDSSTEAATRNPVPAARLHLLYLITRAERGGAQMHVLELAKAMREYFDVSLATGEEGFLTDACRDCGIPVYVLPHLRRRLNPLDDIPAWFETWHLLRSLRPDLIHAHTWKSGFLGRSAAFLAKTPAVYTVHMWPFGQGVPWIWRIFGPPIERLAARWSKRLIAVSESAAEVGRRNRITEPARIVAIENGIKDCDERAEHKNLKCPVIAMVARFTPMKDHETLLRAFALLASPARLLLVGDGPTRAASEKLARELGLEGKVEFAGERSDVAAIMAAIDIFALASTNELAPISILEAMRAGLPVVASSIGGVPQLVDDGCSGLLVPGGSVSALQEALARLVENRDLRIRMGRAGRLRYEQRFDGRYMLARTRALYLDVLSEVERKRASQAALVRQRLRRSS